MGIQESLWVERSIMAGIKRKKKSINQKWVKKFKSKKNIYIHIKTIITLKNKKKYKKLILHTTRFHMVSQLTQGWGPDVNLEGDREQQRPYFKGLYVVDSTYPHQWHLSHLNIKWSKVSDSRCLPCVSCALPLEFIYLFIFCFTLLVWLCIGGGDCMCLRRGEGWLYSGKH